MKDRFRSLFDLAKPLVAEIVTDARDTVGWVVDKGKAVVDKATDISPVVIVRKEKVYNVTPAKANYPAWVLNESKTITTESKP